MYVEDLYRLLRTSHVQMQGIVDTAPDPMLVLDEGLCVQNASRAFFETFKVERYDTIGKPLYELGNGQWDIPELRRLLTDVIPKATAVINYEVEHEFPDIGRRTMLVTARTMHHPDGRSHTMLMSIVDATDRFRRDAAKDLLFGELRHRITNLLAVARSIGRQTTTEGRTAEQFRDDFLGRFGALVEAQDLAFAGHGDTALDALLARVLAPYAASPETVAIEAGVQVGFSSRDLMSLSLVLHELATNAAKYGALSTPGGRLHVSWQVEDDGRRLRLRWVESGGRKVTPPSRRGYGTQLIESVTAYNLKGHVEQTFASGGLETEIVIPLTGASPRN